MLPLTFSQRFKIVFVFITAWFLSDYANAQNIVQSDSSASDSLKHLVLRQVDVFGKLNTRRNNVFQYSPLMSRQLVSLSGEVDVLRYISTLPGVSPGMEGGSGYFVRGSNSGNNRVELDGVPVYGGTHLFGLFSAFPQGIVDVVDYRSGRFPANSGNYLASLARISTLEPIERGFHGSLELSPLMSGGSINGLLTDKLSLVAGGRISLLAPEYRLIKGMSDLEEEVEVSVGDVFLKLQYQLNEKHSLSSSGYYSNDFFKFESDALVTMNWGNRFVRFSWDWKLPDNVCLETMVYTSYYHSGQEQKDYNNEVLTGELRLHSSISEWAAQSRIHRAGDRLSWEAGLKYNAQEFKPRSEKILVQKNELNTLDRSFETILLSGFGEAVYHSKWLELTLGFRQSYYHINNEDFFDLNFRGALSYAISDRTGLELSFDQLSQYHHVLESLPVGWALDVMLPASKILSPEKANQLYFGGYWNGEALSLSGGTYYKEMSNLVRYKNPSTVLGGQNSDWYSDVVAGEGSSYGLELRGERKAEQWDASFSYTLSKTDRRFSGINDGATFPFRFDRRHIFNAQSCIVTRRRSQKSQFVNLSISGTTGNRVTLPLAMYKGIEPPYWSQRESGLYVSPQKFENALYRQKLGAENSYILPAFFRVDAGYTFQKKTEKYSRTFTLGIYNVLNRKNPYLIFHEDGRWQQLSIFPVFPSVKWLFEF